MATLGAATRSGRRNRARRHTDGEPTHFWHARRDRDARLTRLNEIGAALEDGLGFVSRHLVLPALGALDNVFGGLFGVSFRSGGLERNPGVVALPAQPEGD